MLDRNQINQDALEVLKYFTVLDAIADKTSTPYGREKILKLKPSSVKGGFVDWLEQEFDRIDCLVAAVTRGEELSFAGIRDIGDALDYAEKEGTFLEVQTLINIADIALASRRLRKHVLKHADSLKPLLAYADRLNDMPELVDQISKKLDRNDIDVADNASPELRRIRRTIATTISKSKKRLDSLISKHGGDGLLLDTEMTIRDGRTVLAVKAQYRNRIRGIIHGVSASGGTVYIEPDELVVLSNEIRQLAEEEAEEVRKVLIELTDHVRIHLSDLDEAVVVIGLFDSLQARAGYAFDSGAMRPAIRAGQLNLVQARHPLLVLRKGLDETVPLDMKLSDEGEKARTLIITGPNAGGKTVALKTVGLITALIHAGIWPPCGDGTVVPPVDLFHVVIGDDQSLEGDLSSFSGHLEKLKAITQDPNTGKLVLIDEIASGTDPAEGGALAISFLETAVQNGWWTMVSTHMGSLKAFAHRNDAVRNGSMQFDRSALTPTYRFQPDIPGSSYALEIAERVGLGSGLVERARDLLGEESLKLEDLIEELSSRLQQVQKQERDLALKKSETSSLEALLRERIDQFESKKSEKLGQAAVEAELLLRNVNKTIEKAVKDLREEQASKEAIKKAHEVVKKQKDVVERLQQKAKESKKKKKTPVKKTKLQQPVIIEEPAATFDETSPIQMGDQVRMENGMRGEVLALQSDKIQVATGAIKLWIKVDQVSKIKKQIKVTSKRIHIHVSDSGDTTTKSELKLLGKRFEEAEDELERYLEKLALSGLKSARIVHGKGSGTLRSMVLEKLKKHPLISKYRLGEPAEGGDGVTVVELKD